MVIATSFVMVLRQPLESAQHAVAHQIANEFAAPAQKAQIFDPLDRAADVTVGPDHGLPSR
jgi:hypothetical protein